MFTSSLLLSPIFILQTPVAHEANIEAPLFCYITPRESGLQNGNKRGSPAYIYLVEQKSCATLSTAVVLNCI